MVSSSAITRVIDALMACCDISGDRILDAQAKRRETRGGFAQKIMLLRTS
jgi:hypothetical protein